MTLKVGMLGFAHVHAPGFAHCLTQLPGVELAAISDADPNLVAKAVVEYGGEPYADFRELVKRDDISAVVIMSANAHHHDMAVAAAEAGKHVLCEKPLATTWADAQAMVEACRKHNVKLGTAFPMRFNQPAIAFRKMIQDGAIGTPLMAQATNQGQFPGGWFGDPELAGGGAVMDHVVHVADMLRWIFGQEIVEVYAEIDTRLHPGLPVDDVGMLTLTLSGGLVATLDPSWSRPKTWPTWGGLTIEVIGEKGVLAVDAFKESIELFADDEGHRLLGYGTDSTLDLAQGFVNAIRNDTEPPVTGLDGLKATEVVLCAYESARRHEPVPCPDVLK